MEAKTAYNKALKLIQRATWVLSCAVDADGWPDNAYRTNFANIYRYPSLAKKIDYKKLENYFPINKYSSRLKQFLLCPKTTLYFYDISTGEICQLKGKMDVVKNPARRAELWQEEWQRQFPEGVNDEDFMLIHFQADILQYYDGFSDSFWGPLKEAFEDKPLTKNKKNAWPARNINLVK
ncbi:pyridoxamine 5'-phosphate oxidase family protein [Candidatus Avelusimicrobium sp.]